MPIGIHLRGGPDPPAVGQVGHLGILTVNSKKIAETLSIILGPLVWLPILLFVFVFKTGLTNQQIIILLPVLFFQMMIPLIYLYFALKSKKVADFDLNKRQERYEVLLVSVIVSFVSLTFIYFLGSRLLLHLYLIIFSLVVISTLVTFFWKISLHVSLNTAGAILVNFLFNWQLPVLYLSIPLVFWARWNLKKHTVSQLLAAFIMNTIFVLTALHYFNYFIGL